MKSTLGFVILFVAAAACNKDASPTKEGADTAGSDEGSVSSIDEVDECKSYIAKVEECGDSTLESRKKAVTTMLEKGKNRSAIKKFCEGMGDRYTCRKKGGAKGDDDREAKSDSTDTGGDSDGPMGIKECDDYLARLKECGEDDQFVGMTRKGFQIKLDEGKDKETIAKSCGTLLKVYKCKNKK
jgi:hypothetical protein